MTERRTYWQRLKDHQGVPVATFMTIAGFFAGMDRGVWFAVFAACFAGGFQLFVKYLPIVARLYTL